MRNRAMPARRMARLVIYVRSRVGSLRSRVRLLLRPRPAAPYVPFLVSLLPCITKSARGCACRERAAKETAEHEAEEPETAEQEPAAEPAAEQEAAEEPETAEHEAEEPETDEDEAEEHQTDEQTARWKDRMPARCERQGCNMLAKADPHGNIHFCGRHGGGFRCKAPGCTKNAIMGPGLREFCTNHGPRCNVLGCGNGQRRNGLCKKHYQESQMAI